MPYQAFITFDFTNRNTNGYQELQNAIAQCQWDYTPTSSLYVDGAPNTEPIKLALDAIARCLDQAGTLRMMSIHVQLIGHPRQPPAAQGHTRALEHVRNLPSPTWPPVAAIVNVDDEVEDNENDEVQPLN